MNPALLSLADAAKALGVELRTLRGWAARGVVPIVQPAGRGGKLFIARDALDTIVIDGTRRRSRIAPIPAAPIPRVRKVRDPGASEDRPKFSDLVR